MAVLYRVNQASADHHEQLLARLLQEWRAQQVGKGEPLIIEEAPHSGGRANHLYVVWSEWADLTPIERSRLILQAYAQYRGSDLANSVTLAMGLTPDEARHMNIEV